MNRLKVYFSSLDKNNITYETIYAGAFGYDKKGNIFYITNLKDVKASSSFNDPTYWNDDVSYTISRSHKFTLSKPSIRISIPLVKLKISHINQRVAATDFILRHFNEYILELNEEIKNPKRTDKENGKFYSYFPTNKVIERNMCYITGNNITEFFLNINIMVQLPEKNHKKAMQMVCIRLPDAVNRFLENFDYAKYNVAIELYNKQMCIRKWLATSDYCTFIANDSILPRKGNSLLPDKNAIPFISPKENEIEILGIKGMGIKKGVTVITGGGYSGKTTVLDAISSGIYNHVYGDGRELVITDNSAMEITAEDGRSIKNVNLSPFIKWISNGNTQNFSTEHASGSTSQAANIMEAINYGVKLLLIDEDKSATNFMIRDKMMKAMINKEPLTPFTERVRQLFTEIGVSTIVVIGGSGEYLAVADTVLMMDEYIIYNATKKSIEICNQFNQSPPIAEDTGKVNWCFNRKIKCEGFSPYPKNDNNLPSGTEKLEISNKGFITIGDEEINVMMLHNIISTAQLNAIGYMLRYLEISNKNQIINIQERVDELYKKIKSDGLDCVYSTFFGCGHWLELPRKYELLATINRMRYLEWTHE